MLAALLFLAALPAVPAAASGLWGAEPPDAEENDRQADAAVSSAAAAVLPPFTLGADVDQRYDKGIALMYRLEFDKAEAEFRSIIALDTGNPAGYFALGALSWWRYSQNFDVKADFKAIQDEFMLNSEMAIKTAREGLARGRLPAGVAYFFMGSAYGAEGRWYAVQRHWFKAYTHGKKGRKYLKKCVELDPGLYDAYLGLGIYDYFADTLPGILNMAALLFLHGDKVRGLEEIRLAIDKGRFFSTEARLFLIEMLARHENDVKGSLAELEKLKASDPSNMFFDLVEIMTLVNGAAWERVIEKGPLFLENYARRSPPGLAQQLALVYLSVGDSYLAMNRPEEAVKWFTDGIELTAFPDKGWITYSYLRRGQALDLLGKRDEAVKDYGTVVKRDNFWDSQKYGKLALKKAPDFKEIYRQLVTTE